MKYRNTTLIIFGALALGFSAASSATSITNTIDASNPGGAPGTTYWTPDLTTTGFPYYRGYGEDWGWQHNAIGGSITSASLNIAAWDVDFNRGEVDNIEAYNSNTASWELLGSLAGSNNAWEFTNFTLGSSWYDEINAGLQVRMLIDVVSKGNWLVALSKSALSVNGGTLPNPKPGAVPIPAAAFMFAPALLGFMGLRRKAKKTVV